jgi:hypothetical protein
MPWTPFLPGLPWLLARTGTRRRYRFSSSQTLAARSRRVAQRDSAPVETEAFAARAHAA